MYSQLNITEIIKGRRDDDSIAQTNIQHAKAAD
jgi:hypothetical protein